MSTRSNVVPSEPQGEDATLRLQLSGRTSELDPSVA